MSSSHFSSPNSVTWDYFHTVEMAVSRAKSSDVDRLVRQDSALAIVMAVNAVEVFMNLYFRVLVEEAEYKAHREYYLGCIKKRKGLDYKLRNWPKKILGKELDFKQGAGLAFNNLKNLRNQIVHFTSSHDTITLEGDTVIINGMADTTDYNSLDAEKAENALYTSRDLVKLLAHSSGVPNDRMDAWLHTWCGWPISEAALRAR